MNTYFHLLLTNALLAVLLTSFALLDLASGLFWAVAPARELFGKLQVRGPVHYTIHQEGKMIGRLEVSATLSEDGGFEFSAARDLPAAQEFFRVVADAHGVPRATTGVVMTGMIVSLMGVEYARDHVKFSMSVGEATQSVVRGRPSRGDVLDNEQLLLLLPQIRFAERRDILLAVAQPRSGEIVTVRLIDRGLDDGGKTDMTVRQVDLVVGPVRQRAWIDIQAQVVERFEGGGLLLRHVADGTGPHDPK